MVSTTFLNLEDKKQERIIQAALDEFSIKSFGDASITSIVKKANISRGSFYQYFGSKENLYQYLVSKLYVKHRQDLYDIIKFNSGNLYDSLIDFYNQYIDEIMSSKYFPFYQNTFLYDNHYLIGEDGLFSLSDQSSTRKKDQKNFISIIDMDFLRTDSKGDLLEFIYFTVNLIHHMIVDGFINDLSSKDIKERSFRAVNWLYYGIQDKNKESSG